MKEIIATLLFFSIVLSTSCSNDDTKGVLKGDLFFSVFRIGSLYNQPDSISDHIERYVDSLTEISGDDKFVRQFNLLKEHALLYHPFVAISIQEDSIVTLYLDSADYELIKIHKFQELQSKNKKVIIEAKSERLDEGFFYCKSLKRVEVVDGQTLPVQRKLLIKDYE